MRVLITSILFVIALGGVIAFARSPFPLTGLIGTGTGMGYGGPQLGLTGRGIGAGTPVVNPCTGKVDLSEGCTLTVAIGLGV